MSTPRFHSILAPAFNSFVTFKQLQGYDYSHAAKHLQPLDQFLCQRHFNQPYLTTAIVQAYVAHSQPWAPTTRYTRLTAARTFARYWRQQQPASCLWHELPVKRVLTRRFYLYDDHEIQALMHQAQALRPASSLRPHTYATLIGLLAVTGLRIQEALDLDLGDWNPDDRVLLVRRGKFGKDRLLPLTDSTVAALQSYVQRRHTLGLTAPTDPLFLSRFGRRFPYRTVLRTFRQLVEHAGLGQAASRPPRIHDLRHTFATQCLLKWYQQGHDVNAKLPILVTYMGHVSIQSTHVYLHATQQILAQANQRFEHQCQVRIQI